MACTLATVQTAACSSGIGKVRDPIMLRQIIAQLACEAANTASPVVAGMVFSYLQSYNRSSTSLTHPIPSFAPAANALVLCCISRTNVGTISSLTGNGLTWVLVNSSTFAATGAEILMYRSLGSPTPGTLTITSTVACALMTTVFQVTGVNTSGTNGSGAIAQSVVALSPSATLAALNPNGRNVSFGITSTITVPSDAVAKANWTLDCNQSDISSSLTLSAQHRLNSTDTAYASGATCGLCASVAAEIIAA